MEAKDFTANAPGRLIRTLAGHDAFLPNPLPPTLPYGPELLAAQSAADLALGKLAGVGQMLANPHLLIRPFLRREAAESSRIEGTKAGLSDLLVFEADPSEEPEGSDVREVYNYVTALEFGMDRLKKKPLTLNLIREMHALLMVGVRGDEKTPGEFRRRQVFIGRSAFIEQATFVPPPWEELGHCLDAFEQFLHKSTALPALVRMALIHYQFEVIHPFNDGNGRLGRMLITLLLCMLGVLPQPLLYLSAHFESNRAAYYRHLLRVSQAGEWADWILFFLNGVTAQATDAVDRSTRLLALHREFRSRIQAAGLSTRLLELVDHLTASPAITVADAARVLGVTTRQGLTNVNKLVELGILREATGRQRNRVFVATEIVAVVEDRLNRPASGPGETTTTESRPISPGAPPTH